MLTNKLVFAEIFLVGSVSVTQLSAFGGKTASLCLLHFLKARTFHTLKDGGRLIRFLF